MASDHADASDVGWTAVASTQDTGGAAVAPALPVSTKIFLQTAVDGV